MPGAAVTDRRSPWAFAERLMVVPETCPSPMPTAGNIAMTPRLCVVGLAAAIMPATRALALLQWIDA